DFEQYKCLDKKGTRFTREAYCDLSPEAIAYSLYKYGADKNLSIIRVSDLYRMDVQSGVFKEFGLRRTDFEKALRFLSSDTNRVLIAELNMGLEHITLRDDLTPYSALAQLIY
ncbi:MAG: phosphoadenosine phosphosulfate reductase, partial [Prevotellamassilia sp.]|nr:phosphoadenosine phosphosulfate reductase [Prevotellamassilia sp.]